MKPLDTNTFAGRLRTARIHSGYSQEEVARKLKITPATYGTYERGLSEPRATELSQLCEILGVSGGYILGTLKQRTRHVSARA